MDRSGQGNEQRLLWRSARTREYASASLPLFGNKFNTSSDGSKFYFPKPFKIEKNSSLLEGFKNDLKCLGGYSEDEDQNFWNDKSCLTFLNTEFLPKSSSKEMKVCVDLNEAIEQSKPYTGTLKKSFENYLSWILSNKDEKSAELFRNENKIICMKNAMTNMLKIPDGVAIMFGFYAVHVNGVTYVLNEKSIYDTTLTNWGSKFEQFLTYGENIENGVTENLDYRCVMSSTLGSRKLFFSSSIDCVNPDLYEGTLADLSSCLTFKCRYDNPNNEKKYLERFKMYDWCAGITLCGIPQILVGFRDLGGTVRRLKLYSQDDLAREGKDFWNMNSSFTFLDKLLSYVEERTRSKPGKIFSFVKPERAMHIKSEEVDMEAFIPSWFTDEFKCSSA